MIILMNSLIFDDTYQSLILSLFTFCNLSHPSVSQDPFFLSSCFHAMEQHAVEWANHPCRVSWY